MRIDAHPLAWKFNQDDGFYYAEGYYTGGFEIRPMTTVYADMGPKTTFRIFAEVDEDGHQIDIGICHELASAKQICELLENG